MSGKELIQERINTLQKEKQQKNSEIHTKHAAIKKLLGEVKVIDDELNKLTDDLKRQ